MSWAVAMIMPNSERRAVLNLERQGFEVYAPHCKPSRISRVVALFPGYAFIRIEHFWTSILGTFGVRGLIMNGEKPGIVGDEIVQDIRRKEGPNGLVNL